MRVVKGKTGCWCSNCDNKEAEYTITSNNGTNFKLYWACGNSDSEIGFCEDCTKELFRQFACALNMTE